MTLLYRLLGGAAALVFLLAVFVFAALAFGMLIVGALVGRWLAVVAFAFPAAQRDHRRRIPRCDPTWTVWRNASHRRSSIIRLVIQVIVNGKAHRFEPPLEISALLAELRLAGRKMAVERNGEIVPRSAHAGTVLADGDRLEIVVAVGGG